MYSEHKDEKRKKQIVTIAITTNGKVKELDKCIPPSCKCREHGTFNTASYA